MGETEGKKEEADYKRLQTFPLVRVSLGREESGHQAPQSARGQSLQSAGRGLCWLQPKHPTVTVIHSFIHSFIHQVSSGHLLSAKHGLDTGDGGKQGRDGPACAKGHSSRL